MLSFQFYAAHEFFLLPASQAVFLVCVRGDECPTQATQQLEYWLRFIKCRIPRDISAEEARPRVLIVVTHLDKLASETAARVKSVMTHEACAVSLGRS